MNRGIANEGLAHTDIHLDAFRTGNTGLAHATCNDRRMRGLAATAGQNTLRGEETMDILRLGLLANQDDALPGLALLLCPVSIEHGPAAGGTR